MVAVFSWACEYYSLNKSMLLLIFYLERKISWGAVEILKYQLNVFNLVVCVCVCFSFSSLYFLLNKRRNNTHGILRCIVAFNDFWHGGQTIWDEQKENTPWIPPLTRSAFGERCECGGIEDSDRFTYSDFLLLIPELLFVARDNFRFLWHSSIYSR